MRRPNSLTLFGGLLVPSFAGLAMGMIVPTTPTGTNTVFRAGENCTFSFERDPTGLWKDVNVDLFSGSFGNMTNITRVASGLDGTFHHVRFVYECPEVDPPAPIYFYQFSTPSDTNRVWSERFAIASKDGIVVNPEHDRQPNGAGEPWGNGKLATGASSSSSGASSSATATSPGLGLWPGNQHGVTPTAQAQSIPTQPTNVAWANPAPALPPASTAALSGFQYGQPCSADLACPEEAPCCSEFGFCGAGRNCLAGCNPLGSFRPAVCAPVPACRSQEYRFDGNSARILPNSSWWNGDAEQYDWVVRSAGKPEVGLVSMDSVSWAPALTLSLAENTTGTSITSTRSVLYGNITARIRAAAQSGVLTTFTLLSGTADEILFEFTKNTTDFADTAYFFRGEVDGDNARETVNVTDRAKSYHDYTLSWTPELIVWLVDGVPVRNVSKEDTASGWLDKSYRFPRTPARIRLSIWAAGGADQPENVIEFAGGPISWNSSDYMQKGHYASYVSSVKVDCVPLNASTLNASSSSVTSSTVAPSAIGTGVTAAGPSPIWLGWAAALSAKTSAAASDMTAALPTGTALFSDAANVLRVPSWMPNARLRRRIELEKVRLERRDGSSSVSSYTYGEVDKDGYVNVHGGSAPTIVSNDKATGLDMAGGTESAQASGSGSTLASTSTTSGHQSPTSASSTSASANSNPSDKPSREDEEDRDGQKDELTVQEKWDNLGMAAHIGIYVGAAFAALFLLVLIGWIWRKATKKRAPHGTPAGYFPVGDRNNGGLDEGDMHPSGELTPDA
ncbi:hypothetical protein JCM3774_005054 [Rhodotorula dairenensis]